MAAIAWLIAAVYYFYQYTLRSAPAVMMPQMSEGFGLTAAEVTGQDLRVEIYARGALAPKQKTADLPSDLFLPEAVTGDPLDLLRAASSQTIRREGHGTAVRIHSGGFGTR